MHFPQTNVLVLHPLDLTYQVLLPYLRLKLHDLFLMLGGLSDASIIGSTSDHVSNSTEDPRPTRRQTIQRLLQHAFLQLYPWTNLAWTVSAVGWNLAYLFGKTRFWGLEGWALGLVMARAERVDLVSICHLIFFGIA